MIIFDGYLTGSAEKWLHKKNREFGRNVLLVAVLLFFPIILFFSIETQKLLIIPIYSSLFVFVPLLSIVPQSKKEKRVVTPHKIIIDDKTLTCKAVKFEEIRFIQDVKVVKDHGDFYEIIFPFGKVSNNFICQKNLLSKGSIENFEILFKSKMDNTGNKTGNT